jgi:hypothetical protein
VRPRTDPAIYIDFECLAPSPGGDHGPAASRPQVLGVLWPDGRVCHYLVDPPLHDARRARRESCECRTLQEAAMEVLAYARTTGCAIVSWSEFDRRIIEAHADLDDDALATLAEHHVNALGVARRWARRWKVNLDGDPSSGNGGTERVVHSLDRYFAATGYVVPARLGLRVLVRGTATGPSRLVTLSA